MVYYGNGGFNFSDLYTMPVYLRNFYFKRMVDVKKKENEQQEQANKAQSRASKEMPRPNISRKPSK